MGRRTKGQETRSKLLAIAAREFAARGFNETKVETIVREAGLTKPAFYIYFASKQAVFDEIVREGTARLKDEVRKVGLTQIVKNELASDRIKHVLEKLLAFLLENRDVMVVTVILNQNSELIIKELTEVVKENLRTEADIDYIKPVFADEFFADILVTNVLVLSRNYLLTGRASPSELANVLFLLLTESILK